MKHASRVCVKLSACISRARRESGPSDDSIRGQEPNLTTLSLSHCHLSNVDDEEPWPLITRRAITVGIYVLVYHAFSFTTAP